MKLIDLLVFILQSYFTLSNIIGIDLGSEFFKITILQPGKTFTMVENLQSKTKTPFALAFKDDERFFGTDATVKRIKIPNQVFTFMHQYLGKKFNSEKINKFIEEYFVSYEMEEDENRKSYSFKINYNNDNYSFSVEEIFGMMFRYIKYLSYKFAGGSNVKDCVITVPAFFGYKERLALIQAVKLSELNLLSLVSENVAAAVHFATYKEFSNTEYYIFYNMGSSNLQATLVAYTSRFEERSKKTVEVSKEIKILGEAWEKNSAGNALNYKIVRYLMKQFDESRKDKPSVMKDYKVAEKLLPAAIKLKEVLSANKVASTKILGVEGGANLDAKITREEFETINSDIFDRVYRPIEKLLHSTGISIDQIKQVELLGGSVRVPKVQEILKSKMGNIIGTHMNGDDSMALGATYIAANYTPKFRQAKKIELIHGTNYDLIFRIGNSNKTAVTNEKIKVDENFEFDKSYQNEKNITFTTNGDIMIEVYEKLEYEFRENLIMTYYSNDINSASNDNMTLDLNFKTGNKGILSVKAYLTYTQNLYANVVQSQNGDFEINYTTNNIEPLTADQIAKEVKKYKLEGSALENFVKLQSEVGKSKTDLVKKELNLETVFSYPKPLNPVDLPKLNAKLDSLDKHDETRLIKIEKKNILETLIYNKKEWLISEGIPKYASEAELQKATQTLNEISEWFEDEGYRAELAELDSKLKALRQAFSEIDKRVQKDKALQTAIDKFHINLDKLVQETKKTLKEKPWTQKHFNNIFMKEINSARDWLKAILKSQDFEVLNYLK
jgi:hypoxia up-regulated 1